MSVLERLDEVRDRHRDHIALQEFSEGNLRSVTYGELAGQRAAVSAFLIGQGIEKGDRVAILSEGRIGWGAAFFGVIEAGGIVVPLDVKLKEPELVNLLNHAQAKGLLVSGKYEEMASRLAAQVGSLKTLLSLEDQSTRYPALGSLPPAGRGAFRRDALAGDTALIVYTSGTTGTPKGVEITCGSLRFEVESFERLIGFRNDRLLSILPVNHLFEITGGFLGPLNYGSTITYCRSPKPADVLEALRKTSPTVMLVVPLVLKMLHESIFQKVRELPAAQRRLFFLLLGLSRRLDRVGIHIGRFFFPPVRAAFGGKFRCFVCGGAPLDPELARDFSAMGLPVLQGYGLTETAPVLACNGLKENRIGSVGKPLPGVEVRIIKSDPNATEGEIVTRGPNVMRGYYRNPKATDEVLKDGWFHTGDLGYLDKDGFLFISGRIKNLIVTGGGKKVQPEELEEFFSRIPQLKEICILGRPVTEGLKAGMEEVYAVIVPNGYSDNLKAELLKAGEELANYKRPVGFVVWNGEELPKTATRKIKRLEVRKWLLEQPAGSGTRLFEPKVSQAVGNRD